MWQRLNCLCNYNVLLCCCLIANTYFEFYYRDLVEIKESERRACSQADVLRSALDEHSLELRVKAANETEAACQQRLSAAEIEIAELRSNLDSAERFVVVVVVVVLLLLLLQSKE